jgi:hypothetical protein
MQDWDTRIKNLKTDIQVAREKYVVPFLNAKPKTPPAPKEVTQTLNPAISAMASNQEAVGEKIYENKDPVSSLDLIDKTNNAEQSQNVGLTEEITNKIDNALEKSPTIDVNEAVASAEAPTVDVNEAVASAEALTVDVNEAVASAEVSKIEEDSLEGEVKKTELELLEERDENDLSEEEEDRMYELRRLRAQKNMNNEVRETEEAELKKADEEIAHLKTLLKPKPKKLPKGYIA